jgi:hypothetical protein
LEARGLEDQGIGSRDRSPSLLKVLGLKAMRSSFLSLGFSGILGMAVCFFDSIPLLSHEEWVDVEGEAFGAGDPDLIKERARQDALTGGMVKVLKGMATAEELKGYEGVLKRVLLSRPEEYLREVTDEAISLKGSRALYRARVRFDREKILSTLEEIGVRDPRERPQVILVNISGAPENVTAQAFPLLDLLKGFGFALTSEGDGTIARLSIEVGMEVVPHPLMPEEGVTRYPIRVTLLGPRGHQSFLLYSAEDPFSPPLTDMATPLLYALLQISRDLYKEREEKNLWFLGPFLFKDFDSWQVFHTALMGRVDLFPRIQLFRIKKEKGYLVEYRFYPDPREIVNAKAWLINQGYKTIHEEGNRLLP